MEEILNIIQEIWKPIINYEGLYEISNYGRIKSLKRNTANERIRKSYKNKDGHLQIILCKNGRCEQFYIHRLVLETFIGPCPMGMECCHNDSNGENNFIGNLRWDTRSENIKDSIKHGTWIKTKMSRISRAKLNDWTVRIIKHLLKSGKFTQKEIGKIFNVTGNTICHINTDRTWNHIK
jgi:hypothetical protein